jgi:protein phosphatase
MVDSWEILPVVGDRYLICSDGLFNEVDDSRLASTMRRLADPVEAARELVRLANEAGGRDNITCVVVDVVDDSGRAPVAAGSSARITARQGADDPRVDDLMTGGAPAAGLATGGTSSAAAPGTEPASDAGPADGSDSEVATVRRPRRRRFTWRVALFALAFLAVIGVAIGVIVYMGRNTYYVGVQDEQVVIFRGRPGGVLWIEPELAETTSIAVSQVPAASIEAVRAGVEESSLADAREYVANVQDQIAQTTASTTTSTTTTAPVDPAAGLVPPPTLAPSQG